MIFKIIIALIVLYILVELGLFYYRVKHLPKLPAISQTEKSLGQGPPLKYIAAGDSTAAGVGASSLEGTYGYKIAEYFSKTNSVDYKNIGVQGYKTSDVLEKQIPQIIAFKPDVVTISMGANDATHLLPASEILKNYKNIISELEAKTSAKIYITDIANFSHAKLLPWFYITILEYRSNRINPQILNLEDSRVKIINIHDLDWSNYPDIQKTFAADNFHPNDIAYQNWADAFLGKIMVK